MVRLISIFLVLFSLSPQFKISEDSILSIIVYQIAKNYHYKPLPSDEESFSEIFLNSFLNNLDSQRRIFLQSDIDFIMNNYAKKALYFLKKGEVSLVEKVYDIYYERLEERENFLYKIIKEFFDFSSKEKLSKLNDKSQWLNTKDELNKYWTKTIKHSLISSKASNEYKKGTKSLQNIKNSLLKRYENFFKNQRMLSKLDRLKPWFNAFLGNLDSHSSYITPIESKDYDIRMKLKLTGIGAVLSEKDDYIQITSIIPGGPADKDKRLQVNDIITSVIEKSTNTETDLVGMDLSKAVRFIRGEKGTTISLNVLRGGEHGINHTIELIRDIIHLEQARAKGKVISTTKSKKVGYINIPNFYADYDNGFFKKNKTVSSDVEAILKDFNTQEVEAVVIDLRFNTGGFLQEAIELSGLFIGQGPIVQTRTKHSNEDKVTVLKSNRRTPVFNKPVFVLVSAYSASASEIFAAAIQDYHRGIIIGDYKTHGKGTVQILAPLTSRIPLLKGFEREKFGSIRYTIQKFYRINGDSTQLKGVVSDIEFPSYLKDQEVYESSTKSALPWDKIDSTNFSTFMKIETINQIKSFLKEQSLARIKNSKKFQEIQKDIILFSQEQKNSEKINLNYEVFFQEYKNKFLQLEERDKRLSALLGRNHFENKKNNKHEDIYLSETLNIIDDYFYIASK